MLGSPPQEAVLAAAQGKEQGARPGEPGSGSLGTTDVSKPQHQGAGEEAGVTFSSKCLVSLQGSREDSGM